jgi:hypothetical protein
MNMEILKPSRRRLKAGDIFVYKVKSHDFGYGRVVRTDALFYDGPRDAIVLYFYNAFSPIKDRIPELDRRKLLFPPIFTNRLAWSHGYFESIENRAPNQQEVYDRHCFRDDTYIRPRYFDEDGRRLTKRMEPCGDYVLASFQTIDYRISEALGVEPSPDTYDTEFAARLEEAQRQESSESAPKTGDGKGAERTRRRKGK